MKKKLLSILFSSFLFVCSFSSVVSAKVVDYQENPIYFSYDDETFNVENNTGTDIVVTAKELPDDGGGHNTVLGCVIRDNTAAYALHGMSDDDLISFKQETASYVCKGVFEIDDGISVTDEGYENDGDYCEYHMFLSDGSECYAKILNVGYSKIYTLLMRLCPYSSDLNDAYKQVYDSFSYSYQNPNDLAEAAREPFEANLSCGFYIPGVDIPEGTYNLTAVSGSGNVYMHSKINEIMSSEDKEYYIPTFNGARLSGSSPLVISGDLVLNIKSDSARTQEMSPRVINSEAQTDLGAGNYTAGVDFPVGAYNIVCTSGMGNIHSSEADINEILNVTPNDHGIDRINNASFSNGDMLEISGCSVQLQPVGE